MNLPVFYHVYGYNPTVLLTFSGCECLGGGGGRGDMGLKIMYGGISLAFHFNG